MWQLIEEHAWWLIEEHVVMAYGRTCGGSLENMWWLIEEHVVAH
jgi:hypothetical protein